MQSEIINEIIEVEDHASSTVEKAKVDSNIILNKASIKAKKIVKDSVKQCKATNQIEYDTLIEQNAKEVNNFKESLKSDYSKSTFDYKTISAKLAKKICTQSVFKA